MNRYRLQIDAPQPRPLMKGDKIWWVEQQTQYIGYITGEHIDMEHDHWIVNVDGNETWLYKRTPNVHRFTL